MSSTFIRVVKVGGSLLDLPDLPERLRNWLDAQSRGHQVLVVGGGALVDQVRRWNQRHPINDDRSHWMCVELLNVTSLLLNAWLPELSHVDDDRALCQRVGQPGVTIFAPGRWLRAAEPGLPGTWLPYNWETTSDAIAGRLAVALGAHELVLLKSALPQQSEFELAALATGGYLDHALARMAPELPRTRLVDFQSTPPSEIVIAKAVE